MPFLNAFEKIDFYYFLRIIFCDHCDGKNVEDWEDLFLVAFNLN